MSREDSTPSPVAHLGMSVEVGMLASPFRELPDVFIFFQLLKSVEIVPEIGIVICGMDVVMTLTADHDVV